MTKKINKDELISFYITQNLSQKETADLLNCSEGTLRKLLKAHQISKSKDKLELQRKKVYLEKYGADHPLKNTQIKEKKEITNLNIYGKKHPLQNKEILLKMKESNILKYKFDNVSKVFEVKEKIKESNNLKYGFDCVLQNPDIREKCINTAINNGNIDPLFGKIKKEWIKEYDLPASSFYKYIKEKTFSDEKELIEFCENYNRNLSNIENIFKNEFNLNYWNCYPAPNFGYKPDFKLSDNLYLNVDGLYWHSELFKKPNYHFEMRKKYEQSNYRIFQFRSDEINHKIVIIKSMINNALRKTAIKVGARKAKIQRISTNLANSFLNENHIKGHKNSKHMGLIYNDELISLISYKRSVNRKSKEVFLDIARFCSKLNMNVIGGFSRLLKSITEEVGEMPVHYWVDLRYGTGDFLLKHGFKLEKETLGWEWTDFENTYNRLSCRANMDERKLTEKEHAAELGLVKIYDAGQRLYIKE